MLQKTQEFVTKMGIDFGQVPRILLCIKSSTPFISNHQVI